jgi:predicted AAA+ superfamily ATPase
MIIIRDLRLGQLLNQAELGRDVALPQPTVHRWLNLLETSYQLVRLHPYAVNRTKRIIKTAKVYWADTGLRSIWRASTNRQAAIWRISY